LQGTYEYGKQLFQAALVLRRSLRYDVLPNNERAQKLADAWKKFSQGINERASRLSVAAVFHRNADKVSVLRDEKVQNFCLKREAPQKVPEFRDS
jgi:hypothetical protein